MPTLPNSALLVATLAITFAGKPIVASVGDRSPFFSNCAQECHKTECTGSVSASASFGVQHSVLHIEAVFHELLGWSCQDHCAYYCMWLTVDQFYAQGWSVPQFYGKWPFVRLLGVQEPASMVFSVLNLAAHWRGIAWFRKRVRPDSPMFNVWHAFCAVRSML